MKSYIHFIRHGTTEGLEKKWFYGKADLDVTEGGLKEIEKYKAEGVYPEAGDAKFFTTGLVRTTQTLNAIYGDVPHEVIEDLQEISFGKWECKTPDDLTGTPEWEYWMANPDVDFQFPEGESRGMFMERIARGDKTLVGHHRMVELGHRHSGRDAVSIIVCHGGAISATMCHWFPSEDDKNFWKWTPDPGRGYTVEFENSEPVRYWKL